MGYSTLKTALDAVVRTNGNQQITGSNLNGVMTTILQGVDILDRANPNDTSGMDKVVLRNNMTFAQQVTSGNTIYEIRDVFDLAGASFTIPSGCLFLFKGGKLLNANFSGSVLNPYLKPEWFGAVADGVTDDSSPFSQCVKLAIASNAVISLTGGKTYAIKTSIDFSLSQKDVRIQGNGATIEVSNPGYIQFQNARYATMQSPQDLTRGGASITLSSLPAGLASGDIINIFSNEVGETSYNTKIQQTTRIGKIDGNTIYLSDSFLFDTTASETTLSFYKPARVEIRNLKVNCNRGGFNAGMRFDYVIPFFDGVEVGGTQSSSYGIVLHGCLDGVVQNGVASFITYGYLVNACGHLTFENIFCPALTTHAIAIATYSNYINVRKLTGIGQLIESHTGFNITFEDCVFGASSSAAWNMRAVGFALRRCRVISIDGSKVQPVLIGSVGLSDITIYDDYAAVFENCVFPMDSIQVNHSGLIEFIGCEFLPNTRIYFGAAAASRVRKGRILRCDNVSAVTFYKTTFELETDRQRFDAVKNNDGEYEIRLALAAFKLESGNGEWRGGGKINDYDLESSGKPIFPIKLYLQRSTGSSSSCSRLYVEFEFTLFSTNRAGDHPFAEKRYRMEFWYYPVNNDGEIKRIVDLTSEETQVSAEITDFAFSGTTANPEEQVVSFNIKMTTTITSFGAARNTIVYDCKVVGRSW